MKISFRIKKNAEFVFDYLTDMQKFSAVHPVITRIEPSGNENYLVHETLKFATIPFSFSYPVVIEKSSVDKKIIMRATVFKRTKIEMQFVLKADKENTLIEEEVQFKSPLPLNFVMKYIFKKQHQKLFKNIELA